MQAEDTVRQTPYPSQEPSRRRCPSGASLALLGLGLTLLAACNPCAEQCRVESRVYDDCLAEWGLEWADLGAVDAVDFRESCVAAEGVYSASLEADALQEEKQLCTELNSELRGTGNDCDQAWEALVSYGSAP